MKAGAIIVVCVMVVALVGAWLIDPASQQARSNQANYEHQMQQINIAREQAELERQQAKAAASVPGELVAYHLWIVGLPLVVLALAGAGALYAYRKAAGRTDQLYLAVKELDARVQMVQALAQPHPVPHIYSPTAHYSPQMRYQMAGGSLPDSQSTVLPDSHSVPSFMALLDTDRVGRGHPLLLGVKQDGTELHGSWLDLYSTALGGLPGTGKTTSQRFFACQTALHGAQFVVCDPHYGSSNDSLGATLDPLRAVFVCEVASETDDIIEAVRFVDDEGRRRLKGHERTPLVLWVDELTALLNGPVGTTLAPLMEEIARQYRKVGVYLSASGQLWLASRSGGSSALRDSFASVIAHRMRRNQARLLLPTDDAARVERLGIGKAVLYRTSGQSAIVAIPNTTHDDVRRVAALLTDDAPTMPRHASSIVNGEGAGKERGRSGEAQNAAPESDRTPDPETARILADFAAGRSVQEIARELCGAGSGRAYQVASARVQAALRGTCKT